MTQPSQNNSKTDISELDPGQILKDIHIPKDNAIKTIKGNSLVPNEFTKVIVTYVTSGNGIGEIETATYYDAGIKQVSSFFPSGDKQPKSEITSFTFGTDLNPAFLSQKYLKIHDGTGYVGVFFALDGELDIPEMGTYRNIKVDILTTDDVAGIALKFRNAINSDASFVASVTDRIVLVTHITQGVMIDAEDVNTAIKIYVTTQGQEPNELNNTYFWIHRPNSKKHHVWYNVGGLGIDPAPVGSEGGYEVAIAPDSPSLVVLNSTIDKINESIYFTAKANNARLVVTCDQAGPTDTINDGNTGFGHFLTLVPGEDKKVIKTLVLTYDASNELIEIDSF